MTKPEKPARMPTSREVYDRIRWDARFDPARFVIGYEARLAAPKEVAFTAFVPDGDVPWHRVLYFREGETLVWDRRTRVDLLSSRGARASAARAASLAAEVFTPIPLHRFDAGRESWIEALPEAEDESGAAPAGPLRVVTWNVLSDEHEQARVQTARRAPAIVAALEAADADVIALQEIAVAVHAALLAAPWVRARYTMSEGPRAPALRPEGDLFLFRVPVAQLGVLAFSRAKRSVAAVVRAAEGSVVVAQVHLPSDFAAQAALNRRGYLTKLLEALGPPGESAAPAILAGDFNWDDGDLDALCAQFGLRDAWSAVHAETTATFDPTRNALAAVMSRTGRPARIDRLFVRDGDRALRPAAASIFATDPIATGPEPLFASDHFGVAVSLDLRSLEEGCPPPAALRASAPPKAPAPPAQGGEWGAPTHHTAVVVVPPAEIWPPIQAIRGPHDRHATRWMPHVTVLYPFVPEADLERAARRIAALLADARPFAVTLDRLGSFTHGHRDTIWAHPSTEPGGALGALHRTLAKAFPACAAQQRGAGEGFTPHLSLAQLDHATPGANALLDRWTREWKPLRFEVASVQLIVRHGETPFEVRCAVPFGGDDPSHDAPREHALWVLREACAYASRDGEAIALHVIGATRLGISADGDLDAVAVAPASIARGAFFQAAEEWLRGAGAEVRSVAEAVAPVLRGSLDGVPFDLGLARMPAGAEALDPRELSPVDLERTDPASALGLGAVRDADAIERALADRVPFAVFGAVARAFKRWAKARGLYSNGFGYLSGFGWTLLAAWGCAQDDSPGDDGAQDESPGDDLARFARVLRACADWPAERPFAVTPEAARYAPRGRDVFVLPTPSAPPRNVARNVIRSTATVLRSEIARAAELAALAASKSGSWDAVFAPYEEPEGAGGLSLEIRAASAASLQRATGWLEGNVLSLLLQLEAAGVPELRPDPRPQIDPDPAAPGARFRIAFAELDPAAPLTRSVLGAAGMIERAFVGWDERPDDATLRAARSR